jgi:hypothetical protein
MLIDHDWIVQKKAELFSTLLFCSLTIGYLPSPTIFTGKWTAKWRTFLVSNRAQRNNLTKILLSEHMRTAIDEYREKFERKEKKP